MPVYHFTFRAYGSWLPNRPQGYFVHNQGWRAPSQMQAKEYRQRMREDAAEIPACAQQQAIQTLVDSQRLQRFELYAMTAEGSHLHVVVAWRDERGPTHLRSLLKSSMTRALNKRFGKREWFVDKAGQNAVLDEAHLHHLVHEYLPKHGLYWRRDGRQSDEH